MNKLYRLKKADGSTGWASVAGVPELDVDKTLGPDWVQATLRDRIVWEITRDRYSFFDLGLALALIIVATELLRLWTGQ